MPPWIQKNIHFFIVIAANLLALGAIYSGMTSDIRQNQLWIKELREQRADETKWEVAAHEKRLDGHDALMAKLSEKLDTISLTLTRIDQRTAGKLGGIN